MMTVVTVMAAVVRLPSYPSSGEVTIAYRIVLFSSSCVVIMPDNFSLVFIFSIDKRNTATTPENERQVSVSTRSHRHHR